jgi:two-component system sensor histidine kinase YesM
VAKFSLRHQLLAWFIGAVTVPLVLAAILGSALFADRLERTRTLDVANTLTSIAHSMSENVGELRRIAFTPYLFGQLQDALVYMNRGYIEAAPPGLATSVAMAQRAYSSTLIKLMHTATQTIAEVDFYPAARTDGTVYKVLRDRPGLRTETDLGYRETDWYQAAAAQDNGVALVIDNAAGEPSLVWVAMIRDLDRHQALGVLRIDASARGIETPMTQMVVPDGDQLVLRGPDGLAIRSVPARSGTALPGQPLAKAPIAGTEWGLTYFADRAKQLTTTAGVVAVALAIAMAAAALAYVIYRRESRAVTAGTAAVVSTLEKMRAGDLSARADLEREDWLGAISESVGHLGTELSQQIDQNYKAVIARQNAEYRALQAQISPHFLHNAFNDFVAMNRLGDSERLEKSILRLSRMLRYSCTTSDWATVAQEAEFAEQYLFLRESELAGRLTYQVKVDPAVADVSMPRLIVQPLVENALVHGLADDATISVQVAAHLDNETGQTVIEVVDDGLGFEPKAQTEPITEAAGFATMNIRERLRILSPRASLEIISQPGEGTRCTIKIPLEAT